MYTRSRRTSPGACANEPLIERSIACGTAAGIAVGGMCIATGAMGVPIGTTGAATGTAMGSGAVLVGPSSSRRAVFILIDGGVADQF